MLNKMSLKNWFLPFFLTLTLIPFSCITAKERTPDKESTPDVVRKTIRSISISGNKLITQEALLARIPYRVGGVFNPAKTGDLIRNLYALNYFDDVIVELEDVSPTEIAIFITVEEKKKVEAICYEGNKNLSIDEIEKKLKLSEVPTMNEEEIDLYAEQIKKLYAEKNYHAVTIETKLELTDRGTYKAIFKINEGKKGVVRKVNFKGNQCVSSKTLRKTIFTREDWIFGFLNKAGSYQPEMVEMDKYVIENYYQSNGYLAARVTDTQVDVDPETQCITVTFTVEEGDIYYIKSVSVPGNEILNEMQLLCMIPIRPGQCYSRELIRQSMENLRSIWGRFGYIYADIEPIIIPNMEEKTVEITFNSELGNKIFLNRVSVTGNCKTRDYVIRRLLTVCEGQMLTTPAMDISKSRVEALGYFDQQNGVEWKTNKISENKIDLELVLKEIKTGKIDFMLGFGPTDPQSPATGFRVATSVTERNLFGSGMRANVSVSWAKEDRAFALNFFQPWAFDKPIGVGCGFFHRRSLYEDFKNVNNVPREKLTGGDIQCMFSLPWCPSIATSVNGGVERIQFERDLRAQRLGKSNLQVELIQSFIDRRFASGTTGWAGITLSQDLRNHPVFPNRGYQWSLVTRFGAPLGNNTFAYVKADFDSTWLTPLINEYDLIFLFHTHAGVARPIGSHCIPYRDLYNMGGPGTVRGFEFGQIGPQIFGSSVGAQNAFWVNAELIFSIMKDQSIRGVLFYDGGAGWDTPLTPYQRDLLENPLNTYALTNNRFRYRHAVGFGLRFLRPMPVRIDWGFKLDRNKRLKENFYEVHFTMAQEF